MKLRVRLRLNYSEVDDRFGRPLEWPSLWFGVGLPVGGQILFSGSQVRLFSPIAKLGEAEIAVAFSPERTTDWL
ncbi:MAG: hypothetical protein RMK20_07645 [Verrucomicrobiales bacterium]|nr:hypothetical protein [Verrucomicrobiales bacterium]